MAFNRSLSRAHLAFSPRADANGCGRPATHLHLVHDLRGPAEHPNHDGVQVLQAYALRKCGGTWGSPFFSCLCSPPGGSFVCARSLPFCYYAQFVSSVAPAALQGPSMSEQQIEMIFASAASKSQSALPLFDGAKRSGATPGGRRCVSTSCFLSFLFPSPSRPFLHLALPLIRPRCSSVPISSTLSPTLGFSSNRCGVPTWLLLVASSSHFLQHRTVSEA